MGKGGKRSVAALLTLVAAAAVLFAGWLALRPETSAGSKILAIQVVHGDGSTKEFTLYTDAEYLGQALLEHEALGVEGSEGQFGLYIQSVDGETASDAEQTFWNISKGGEALTVGAGSQPVMDGERYELTLTKW